MYNIEVIPMEYSKSFEQLTEKEKLYAYYLNKACWAGIPISSFQISYESPALFIIFQTFFKSFENIYKLEELILNNKNISKKDFHAFILYAVQFYLHYANYSSYGHSKFYPQLSEDQFEEILKQSPKYKFFEKIWQKIKKLIYIYFPSLPKKSSKYTDEFIVGTYYLNGITIEEIKKVDDILTKNNISLVNTRLLKIDENKYQVLIGSIEEKEETLELEDKSITILLKYGDFKDYLIKINSYLQKAKLYASNDIEKKIIDLYIETFTTGDIEKHKESQRVWVKNLSPIVEFNLGWIETYIDSQGVRAYYEGIVALQNKNLSIKYKTLVENSDYFISQLPWSKDFEKDKFIKPDFTALDIVGFPTTCIFIGINLPNYLDVHETDGFKSLSLLNADLDFEEKILKSIICEKDIELYHKLSIKVSKFKTSLHELYGHGTGKLFKKDENGNYNFDINNVVNPLTNEKIKSYYLPGETYETKFSTFCRSLEEGRADYMAFYLVFDKKAQQIFEFKEEEYEDVIYIMWLTNFISAIVGACQYNNGIWKNPYSQERFMFLNYVYQNQEVNKEILKFNIDENNQSFKMEINKTNLIKYGKDIAAKILMQIHISKCIGDVKAAKEFVNKYSVVDEFMYQINSMIPCSDVIKIRMNVDLIKKEEDKKEIIEINQYPSTSIGFVKSVVDRFNDDYNEITFKQWIKYYNPFNN